MTKNEKLNWMVHYGRLKAISDGDKRKWNVLRKGDEGWDIQRTGLQSTDDGNAQELELHPYRQSLVRSSCHQWEAEVGLECGWNAVCD